MQLGFVSAILPDLSLEEVLEFAAQENFDCVEVMCWPRGKAERRYAGVTHIDVTEFTTAEAQRVARAVEASGVAVSGLGYYPNPLAPDRDESAAAVTHLEKLIRAAAQMGIGKVNTFVGRDWKKSVDDNWPRFLEVFPPLVRLAEQEGVQIGIENCPMYFTADEWPGGKNLACTPSVWRRMFEAIPSPNFGLNFDPSHLVWMQIDNYAAIVEFAPRFSHAHAKDVRIDRDRLADVGILAYPLQFHTPKIPGLGEIDWPRLLVAMKEAGYDGPVCIEVEDRDFEGSLDSRKEALRQSGSHLRPLIPKK